MNIHNIQLLAARLRQPETAAHFNMNFYFNVRSNKLNKPIGDLIHNCGTIACMGGHAAALAQPHLSYDDLSTKDIILIARDFLGLTSQQSDELFEPIGPDYSKITPEIAASVLDHLAEIGEVLWPININN